MNRRSLLRFGLLMVCCQLLLVLGQPPKKPSKHSGQNPKHHYHLNEPYSDEWLGKCVYAEDDVNLNKHTRTEIDRRRRTGFKRLEEQRNLGSSSFSNKEYRSERGKPFPFDPKKGDADGLKVLIVSVDNRDVHNKRFPEKKHGHAGYASFSAAINNDYANTHGYDHLYVILNSTSLSVSLQTKYNCTAEFIEEKEFTNFKYGPASFHVGLKYMRASSWNKLPALYHLVYEYGHNYDWILYTDTDVTLNPKHLEKSVSEKLREWQHGKTKLFGPTGDLLPNENKYVQWGQTDLSKTNIITLTNFPWRDDMPCAGVFLMRPNRLALIQLQDWWNFNIPMKNLYDFMEQDALWYMKEADSDDKINGNGNEEERAASGYDGVNHTVNHRGIINNGHLRKHMATLMNEKQVQQMQDLKWNFAINSSTMSLVFEPSMTSYYHGTDDIHFIHMPNYNTNKLAYMSSFLRFAAGKLHKEKNFKKAVQNIMDYHRVEYDVLGLVEQMEVHRRTGADPRSNIKDDIKQYKKEFYPEIHRSKPDMNWHLVASSAILTPQRREQFPETIGEVYNHYIVQFSGDNTLYYVQNGTRHNIPDFQTFLNMGFDSDEILVFKDNLHPCPERLIKFGADMLPFEKHTPGHIFRSDDPFDTSKNVVLKI